MATGQDLLDRINLLNDELETKSGQKDVDRGLTALNAAQDHFETLLAMNKTVRGGTSTTVTTAASTESTTFPTGFLRIDRAQYIDPTDSLPEWDLINLKQVGSHRPSLPWWHAFQTSSSTGKPRAYWTDGASIYWDPLPSGTHTVRVYGFKQADDITAGGTFAYPDIAMLPLASFATMLLEKRVDDSIQESGGLADQLLGPVVQVMSRFNRDAPGMYSQVHVA